jgi:hypothetical protein
MRWSHVVLLYLVAALLGGQYWFVERGRPAADAPQETVRPKLVELDADTVTAIRLKRGDRSMVMQRPDERWTAVEPAGVAVPHDLVRAFLQAIVAAEVIHPVEEPTGGLGAYGLGEGATSVDLTLQDGRTLALTLGGTNPTGTALYARRTESPPIVLIGRQVRYYEDLLFQALPVPRVPSETDDRVGAVSPLTIHPGPV